MSVSVGDLKGFDFSKKYLHISKNFSLIKEDMKVDFKIEKDRSGDGNYMLSYSYPPNKLIRGSFDFRNPFGLLKHIENSILENKKHADGRVSMIKKALTGFNPNFNEWDDLYKKLSSDSNLLKLYPNYNSSKIPQDLSKEELAKYLDSMSKFELETLFMNISPIDFEIIYRNLWGEDYEYLIKKAFTSYFFGEKYYDHNILWEINKKREEFYYGVILKEYGFDIDKYDLMVPTIHSLLNQRSGNKNGLIRQLQLERVNDGENNYLNDIDKIDDINTNSKSFRKDVDFNNLDDYVTNAKYVFILKLISVNSASPIVLRYKTPKKDRDENSVQSIALKNNHIEYGNSRDLLEDYNVEKLKNVLRKYELKLTGNKNDLIERIKENLTDEVINKEFPDRLFTLTDEGEKYLEDNYYLAEFYHVIPENFSLEEFDIICKENQDISPDEIISCLVNEKWLTWDESLGKKPDNLNGEYKVKLENIFKKRAKKDYYFKSIDGSVILV